MNKHQAAQINLAAIRNQEGRTVSRGAGRVVGPHREGYQVSAKIACTVCGQQYYVPVVKLSDLLRYPNEPGTWTCLKGCKPSAAADAPKHKSVDQMSADEYRKTIVEPEFARSRASSAPAPSESELRHGYNRVYVAAMKTNHESQIVTYAEYVASSPTDRAAIDGWAESVNGKMQSDYDRVTEAFESVNMTTDPRFPKTFEAFKALTNEDRQCLIETADNFLHS